jgi:hypothetical protein
LTYQLDGERSRDPVAKARGRTDYDRVSAMRFRKTTYLTERVAGSGHEVCVDPVCRCGVLKCGPQFDFDVVLMSVLEHHAGPGSVRGSQHSANGATDVDGNE